MSCCSACGRHACACGCGATARTPLPLANRPGLAALSYRVGSHADFRATMQAGLSDAALPALAGLRTRELDDPAMALLDTWAVGADVLSFYTERIANEAYLRTATERRSVLELARLVDYRLRPGVAASVYLAYTVEKDSPPVTIPAGARAQSVPAPGEQMQTFETAEPLDARYEWNALKPRLTRPQDITLDNIAGLGELWIAGTASNLKPNDRLLFLFGDLPTGVQALRRVQSVEVQQSSGRSKVLLQRVDAVTVAIVAAANAAVRALGSSGAGPNREEWLRALGEVRGTLLLGGDNGGSYDELMKPPFGNDAPPSGPSAIDDFKSAVDAAFGTSAPPATGFTGFGALFGALTLAPTLQPASQLRLQRNIASALGKASDTRPQLLLNFSPVLRDTFYRAWSSVPQGEPSPALSGVYALRQAAALFGYNAPQSITITQTPDGHGGSTTKVTTSELPLDESPGVVRLDNGYDGVAAGSYLVIQPSGDTPTVVRVKSAQVHPQSSYGISGKTTEIALDNPSVDDGSVVWQVPSMSVLRTTQVYAQSESLPLAELTIADEVGVVAADSAPRSTGDSATRLTLDTAVDGLKAGRWVIVEGQRSDVPGTDAVTAAELVMLSAVEQGVDASLPGDTVHSALVFANAGLAYRYKRDTVSIHANVVRATHGESRREVLGSGNGALPMQAFVLKQPPLTYVSASTVDGVQSTLTLRVNELQWHETRNLAFVGTNDRHFVTATDDDGKTTVQFGDGVHGACLPTGMENIVATYRNGIGTPGNVRAQQVSLLATRPLGVKEVINPLRASGGADAETRDQARRNAPLAVLALDRLVSVPDYADFARTFGGVGKAAAVKLGNLVQVTIAGAADAPIDPSSDLYRNLLQALRQYGDPSLPVQLDVRELLALTVSAKVGLLPDYAWESVEPGVRSALLDAFGFERRALAQSVYLSELVACMQAVRGVAWIDVDAFGSLDETTLLAGFGVGGDNGKNGDGASLATHTIATATATVPPRVPVLPARYDDGTLRPAQLAYLPPNIPDTLLLQEATP